jgi:dTDP-4-amino-4,6-dideoxygalactose transaminase
MDILQTLAARNNILLIEDAAQGIDSYYREQPLGLIGDLATFSFHETKNIICGEGGMLVVNAARLRPRAEIIWEKGTNRSSFFRGEIDKYGWVDIGSSFLPSEITAAFLFAQLENLPFIQKQRRIHWDDYMRRLRPLSDAGRLRLPTIPDYAKHNAHLFYVVCDSLNQRTALLRWLNGKGIGAVFHYQALHNSPFYSSRHDGRPLPESIRYSDCLLRLPLYVSLTPDDIGYVCYAVTAFYG